MDNYRELLKNDIEFINSNINSLINENNNIYSEINNFLKTPSKKIRSIVTLLYINAQNATPNDIVLKIIIAGEIIHNASLLHDDVIDGAEYRRNTETIAKKLSSKISVISGDLLISKAIEIILNIDNCNIAKSFIECTNNMCNAEILQSSLAGSKPSVEEYIKICEGKTASLFRAILNSSASILNLNTELSDKFAKDFGILFQLINDIDSKSREQDINNAVHTAIDIVGIEKTKTLIDNYKKRVRSAIKNFPQNVYKEGLEDLISRL